MAPLIVQHGAYYCPECLHPIGLDWSDETMLGADSTITAACYNLQCERRGLRLKIRLQTIEVEELHDA